MSRAVRLSIALLLAAAVVAAADDKAPEPPTYVGDDACGLCHADQAESYAKSRHGQALADPARPPAEHGCEACHGPGSAHVEAGGGKGVGGLETFAKTRPAAKRSDVCLKCHATDTDRFHFRDSAHARAAVACTDCHSQHASRAPALLHAAAPELCWTCHLELRAKFALTEHHPVNEGAVSCLDCHRPHGAREHAALRAPNDRTCYRCHAEIEGPFVFEHAGLVTEGCARCHDPHGSVNRHLLVRQQVAQLCYECHTVTPANHLQPSYRDCTRCHVDIHGSNVDPRFLEQ